MFKLFQNIMGGDSDKPSEIDQKSIELLTSNYSDASSEDDVNSPTEKAELLWQQGNLRETISLYDRAIQNNPDSAEAYQELFSHLKQQNSVAEAYKRLAESLKRQGKSEEAATCYRQAIVIQAVTNEVKEKYRKTTAGQLVRQQDIVNLDENAFSFQRSIKQTISDNQPHLLQIELPQDYIPRLAGEFKAKQLDSRTIATVEWEAAQAFMQKALDSCDREEWQEVAEACKQATIIMPEMAEAYKIWGNALQRMNRTAEAMGCYSKAVEIQPDLAEVYAGIARLYAQQQKWQQAIEYFQKAIIIKPDFAKAYRDLAHVWEQSGNREKAQVCIYRAQEIEAKQPTIHESETASGETTDSANQKLAPVDDSVVTYRKLGQDSEQQNQWHEAAVYYRKALELNLSQAQESIVSEGELTNKENQLARIKKIQKLVQPQLLQPEVNSSSRERDDLLAPIKDSVTTNSQLKKGSTSKREKALDKIIGHYRKKAKLQPNSASIQINLGNLYAKKRKWKLAVACYSKAIRINPKQAEAHLKLAKILAKTGNHSKYVEHTYLAFTLQSSLGSADDHFLLGNALKKLGNRTRAIACYEQAIKLQPHFNEAYCSLAQVFKEIGKPKNAIACYQAAVRHNPEDADLHFNLGELLTQQSLWESAVKAYRQVLELQPTYPLASQKLNRALSEKLKQDLAEKPKK